MRILVTSHTFIEGVTKLTHIDEIQEDIELFYELGEMKHGVWHRSGVFKQISNPMKMKQRDMMCLMNSSYIEHHNFVIRQTTNMEKPRHMMHYTLSACRQYYVGLSNIEVIEVNEVFRRSEDRPPNKVLPKDMRIEVVDRDGKLRIKLPVTYYQII